MGLVSRRRSAQLFHWQVDKKIYCFWTACGVVFLAGGVWMLLQIQWPLAPALISCLE